MPSANSFRSIRGRTLLGVVMDEVSIWRDELSAVRAGRALRARYLPSLEALVAAAIARGEDVQRSSSAPPQAILTGSRRRRRVRAPPRVNQASVHNTSAQPEAPEPTARGRLSFPALRGQKAGRACSRLEAARPASMASPRSAEGRHAGAERVVRDLTQRRSGRLLDDFIRECEHRGRDVEAKSFGSRERR
jgi:hypothetical protein